MLTKMVVSVDGSAVYQGPFVETLELPDLPAGELVVTVQVVGCRWKRSFGDDLDDRGGAPCGT